MFTNLFQFSSPYTLHEVYCDKYQTKVRHNDPSGIYFLARETQVFRSMDYKLHGGRQVVLKPRGRKI